MNKEKFYEKLDEMLKTEKSKKFVGHLIRAYYPAGSTEKVYNKPKGPFKCALLNTKLISVNDVFKEINSEEYKEQFFKSLHSFLTDKPKVASTKKLDGHVIGFQGTNTTTYLSPEAYSMLIEWVMNKIMMGDKYITWLLKHQMGIKTKIKRSKPEMKSNRATYTLGDLDALKNLNFND